MGGYYEDEETDELQWPRIMRETGCATFKRNPEIEGINMENKMMKIKKVFVVVIRYLSL